MTKDEAAQFMVNELHRVKWLDQEQIAWQIYKANPDLTYQNANGNMAINKDVLKEFNKLTNDGNVVWSRSYRQWRFRQPYDMPGRMQS